MGKIRVKCMECDSDYDHYARSNIKTVKLPLCAFCKCKKENERTKARKAKEKALNLPKKASRAKLCAVCKGELDNKRKKYCSFKCEDEAKKEKKLKSKLKTIENKDIKKKAWDWFSLYIRLKYADQDGNARCVTCSSAKLVPYRTLQAGHAVRGRGGYVLFNEKVVRCQCFFCNVKMGGRYDDFMYYLVDIEKSLTPDEYFEIKRQSMITHKISISKHKEIAEKYKALYKQELKKRGLE